MPAGRCVVGQSSHLHLALQRGAGQSLRASWLKQSRRSSAVLPSGRRGPQQRPNGGHADTAHEASEQGVEADEARHTSELRSLTPVFGGRGVGRESAFLLGVTVIRRRTATERTYLRRLVLSPGRSHRCSAPAAAVGASPYRGPGYLPASESGEWLGAGAESGYGWLLQVPGSECARCVSREAGDASLFSEAVVDRRTRPSLRNLAGQAGATIPAAWPGVVAGVADGRTTGRAQRGQSVGRHRTRS
jgi:hypothetical protein